MKVRAGYPRSMVAVLLPLICVGCAGPPSRPQRIVFGVDVTALRLTSATETAFVQSVDAQVLPLFERIQGAGAPDATITLAAISNRFDRLADVKDLELSSVRPSDGKPRELVRAWLLGWAKRRRPWTERGTDLQGFLDYLPDARRAAGADERVVGVLRSDGYDQPPARTDAGSMVAPARAVTPIPLVTVALDRVGESANPWENAAFAHFIEVARERGIRVVPSDGPALAGKLGQELAAP